MPWNIQEYNGRFCVYKEGESEPLKCYDSKVEADDYLAALYANEPEAKTNETIIHYGGGIKALGDGRIGGYLVRYSTEDDPDLEGDFFTSETDFGDAETSDVYYQHGFDEKIGKRVLGKAKLTKDEFGIWAETQLKLRDEYEKLLYQMSEAGKMGWSSGTVAHLVTWEPSGKANRITKWSLGLDASLTPTPAEPRNVAIPIKSWQPEALPLEDHIMSEEVLNQEIQEEVVEEVQFDPNAMQDEINSLKAMVDELKAQNAPATTQPPAKKYHPVNVNAQFGTGDPDPQEDYLNWVRTGVGKIKAHKVVGEIPHYSYNAATKALDRTTVKAAMQEGTTTEGGYWVPVQELGRIIDKRAEMSLIDQLPFQVFTTNSDTFNIPTEGTAMTKFTIVAEEGANSAAENEPTAGQVAVTMYNFKKLIKVSEELLEDENSGLEAFLARAIGRAWGITENYYMQVGTGSSQPQGIFVGGTAGLTLDSASAIGPAEVPELIGKLKIPYRQDAVLIMRRATGAYLAGLRDTSDFAFRTSPTSMMTAGGADLGVGYPVYLTEDAAAIAASAKSMIFGSPSFYGWVRNRGLRVRRLVELYAGNGQVGILANYRCGGGVLQAEAWQYASHPSA